MKFKVPIINDISHCHDKTVIGNNKKVAIRNLQLFNPKSKLLATSFFNN